MALSHEPDPHFRAQNPRRLYARLARAFSRVAELADQHAERAGSQGRDAIAGIERQRAERARAYASRARSLSS